ncbi:single-stranded-DNA-specific exonuclease RecJ [Candidatus Weimeria sp. HCP3S3_B5]|uniref:single-stranded-DNA-specific exonuclease RecJ n=1 Tax=Candidatus Weimeria sp. HCP3S3_B5 TaxID=3438871 RepID=UPI003F8C2F43
MAKWMSLMKKADFKKIAADLGIDQVTARVLVNRHLSEEDMKGFLNPDLGSLNDPLLMSDMERACELIRGLIKDKKRIRVVGDYDADGICSTYILIDALRRLGADCDFCLPDRVKDGYGLNPDMVEQAAEDGIEAIITCDNGIAASPAVSLAKEKGMTVIVTDHHEIPFSTAEGNEGELPEAFNTGSGVYDAISGDKIYHLPHADAVIDPHRIDDKYPFPGICGAVVAWKLVFVLFSGEADSYMDYLPEAAFATITDIMELVDENRIIVYYGLKAMAEAKNPGLDALIECSGLDRTRISAYNVGFVLGPCFNASGRIDTAETAVSLLLENDREKALAIANKLVKLNDQRKFMTTMGVNKAFAMLSELEEIPDVIVIYMQDLHESLCGLVAGKLKEKYNRPVFVLCKTKTGEVKGSGRSIEAYSMYEKMVEANEAYEQENPDNGGVFIRFGGHPMAAGLSMRETDIDWLRNYLNQHSDLSASDMEKRVIIDVPMPLWYVKIPLIDELSRLEPFGNGNPRPVFAEKGLPLVSYRMIGKGQQYRKLRLSSHGRVVDALYFGEGAAMDGAIREAFGRSQLDKAMAGMKNDIRLDIVYYPDINDYMGTKSAEARITDFRVRKG